MKLLFDENLSFKLCERIGDLFPESIQTRLAGLSRADDCTVWNYAAANVCTRDTRCGFCGTGRLDRGTPEGHLASMCNQSTAAIERLLRDHAEAIAAFEQNTAACLEIY
jgi:predicted nuclease of predicted toxin-antitoxin system